MDIFSDHKRSSGWIAAGVMLGAVPGIGSAVYVVLANRCLVSPLSAVMLTLYILLVYLLTGAAAGLALTLFFHFTHQGPFHLKFFSGARTWRVLLAFIFMTFLCSIVVPWTRARPWTPCDPGETAAGSAERIDTGLRVILLGLDGADWKVLRVLLEKSELPNFKKLMDGGTWGPLATLIPTKSPVIWTTVATGVTPERHGIMDFSSFSAPGVSPILQKMHWPRITLCKKLVNMAFRTGLAERRPFSSVSRRVPALWNITDRAGLKAGVLNWWCTWPAEKINGFVVTQRVTYSAGETILGTEGSRPAETYPEKLLGDIRDCIMKPDDLTPDDLSPFLDGGREALKKRIEAVGGEKRLALPWFWFSHALQSDRSFERIALRLFPGEYPDLFLLYHQGIDVVEHFFWHCWEPQYFDHIPEEDLEIFRNIIPAYYAYEDRVLGKLMEKAGGNSIFVIVSDHGMEPTGELPKSGDHVNTGPAGIMILHGPCIAPSGRVEASVYDIFPTILYLLGLPVAEDMPGRPLLEAFQPDFIDRYPVRTIPSYGCGHPQGELSSASDEALIRRLKDMGYLE